MPIRKADVNRMIVFQTPRTADIGGNFVGTVVSVAGHHARVEYPMLGQTYTIVLQTNDVNLLRFARANTTLESAERVNNASLQFLNAIDGVNF